MELIQVWNELSGLAHTGMIGLLIILMGMIKIPPIEINFWGWLGRTIGRTINNEVINKVDDLSKEIDALKKEEELERARSARQRILRFNDEILFEKRHSKEHFDEILDDITLYEKYCNDHKDYVNNKATLAIATIKEVYQDCMETHDFLTYVKKVK